MKFICYFLILFICFYFTAFADEISDLVPFIIQVESAGNPYAISEDGCIGLMQINRLVFQEFCLYARDKNTIYDNKWDYVLFNPDYNLQVGTWYLRRLKDHYLKENYTIERLLAAYNGGISHLKQHNYDVSKMPRETRDYVKKVLRLYRKAR